MEHIMILAKPRSDWHEYLRVLRGLGYETSTHVTSSGLGTVAPYVGAVLILGDGEAFLQDIANLRRSRSQEAHIPIIYLYPQNSCGRGPRRDRYTIYMTYEAISPDGKVSSAILERLLATRLGKLLVPS